jgi:hypothetical protein
MMMVEAPWPRPTSKTSASCSCQPTPAPLRNASAMRGSALPEMDDDAVD